MFGGWSSTRSSENIESPKPDRDHLMNKLSHCVWQTGAGSFSRTAYGRILLAAYAACVLAVQPLPAQVLEEVLIQKIGGGGISSLQVYGDTLILERFPDQGGPVPYYTISVDRGKTFDTLTTMRQTTQREVFVGSFLCGHMDNPNPPDPGWAVFWIARGGSVVWVDSIKRTSQSTGPGIGEMTCHPMDLSVMYRRIVYAPVGGYTHHLEISTDGGVGWTRLDIPLASEGYGRELEFRLDYHNSNYLAVGVEGSDVITGSHPKEWWESADRGESFHRIPTPGLLRSVYQPGCTMEFPRLAEPLWDGKVVRSNPVIMDSLGQVTDTLPWLSNIMASLFHPGDEDRFGVYLFNPPRSPEIASAFAFSPSRPGLFVCGMVVDSAPNGGWAIGIAATRNHGKDWFWLSLPQVGRSFSQLAIDEVSGDVYASYVDVNSVPGSGARTISRFKLSTVLAVPATGAVQNTSSIVLFPNPTTGLLTVQAARSVASIENVNVVDLRGNTVASHRSFPGTQGHSLLMDLRELPSGYYLCLINMSDGSQISRPFVIGR
jgi:hypothetical protein